MKLLGSLFACALLLVGCATAPHQSGVDPLTTAKIHLAKAARAKSPPESLTGYLLAAEAANRAAKTSEANKLYTQAVAGAAPLILSGVVSSQFAATMTNQSGLPLTKLIAADSVPHTYFKTRFTRAGVGAPMVGFPKIAKFEAPFAPRRGLTVPVTALMTFAPKPTPDGRKGVSLTLVDPAEKSTVKVGDERLPVAADWTAPIFADLPKENPLIAGLQGLLQIVPEATEAHLRFLEPYDPKRIPVIMVHGLLSTPMAWENVVNELYADPAIRARYQFWVFGYPTGNPIAYSALLFRESIAAAEKATSRPSFVLIGHSMGGILSRLQAVTTHRVLWDAAFGENADRAFAYTTPDSLLRRSLIFSANPKVRRIVFIATPHRGSKLATIGPAQWVVSLIKLPVQMVMALPDYLPDLLDDGRDTKKFELPTSIQGLSPTGILSRTVDLLPIQAPYNSIIGIRNAKQAVGSSDGVVPYSSSHLDGAESEITVPTDHGAFNHPRAIIELRRILMKEAGR